MPSRNTNKTSLRTLALALLVAWAGSAAAQQADSPWYIGAQQTFTHDSNVFRSNDELAARSTNPVPVASDTISSTALLGGVDLPFGRQRLRADLLARHDEFSDQDQLSHDGYRLGLNLDWATIERLSGNVELTSRRELARHDALDVARTTERTLQNVNSASFAARLGATSVLAIEGRIGHQTVDYSSPDPVFNRLEYDQDRASLGVLYRPSGLLTLGVAARVTRGEYPLAELGLNPDLTPIIGPDEYDRKDIDLTAVWVPSGISTVTARLSATDEEHEGRPQLDVSGATGALRWDWRPTGKLRFLSDLVRDTGSQIAFSQLQLPTGEVLTATAPDNRVVNTASVHAFYELTSKIRLDALVRHVDRSFRERASDRTNTFSVGARWDPTRAVGLGCSVGRHARSSDTSAREYDADIVSCFARFVLQG